MDKISIAVIGAKGYVGESLSATLEKNPKYLVHRIFRGNYAEFQPRVFDLLINCAMPSKRFWAKNNPQLDFVETVQKTADLFYGWNFKKFIHISTVSVRTEPESVYGRHKAAAEKICGFGEHLVIRLSAMYSKELTKGALIDILKGNKLFVSGETRYPFASLEFVSTWIAKNLHRKGLVELGARNSLRLMDIAQHLKKKIQFEGPVENQEVLNPEADFPDAKEVLTFMEQMTKK